MSDTIEAISGISLASIESLSGKSKSVIGKVGGVTKPTTSNDISFSDITTSTFDTRWSPTNPFVCSLPSTATSGDFVMILMATDSPVNSNIAVTPSGFTLVIDHGDSSSDNHLTVYTRTFDGTEGSTTDIFCTSTQNRGGVAWSMIVNNIDTTTPFGTIGTVIDSGGQNMTVPSVTSTSAGTFIVFVGFDGADGDPITMTNNGGFTLTDAGTQDSPSGGTGGRHVTSNWRYANIAASTATGTTDVGFAKSDGKAGLNIPLQKA